MSGRFNFQTDQPPSSSWYGRPQSALPPRRDTALDHRVINNNPDRGGNAGLYTQPQLGLDPGHRGFGLATGIPRAPENLIDDFNRDAQTIETQPMAFGPPRSQGGRRTDDTLSPTLTLTTERFDFEDISFDGSFDDDMTTSPNILQSPFSRTLSRTALGIPSSQPLSRNPSQASSGYQDDTASLTYSTTSAGDDFITPLGLNYFTPGTSFSQDFQSSAVRGFSTNSPSNGGFYQSSQGQEPSASPSMDFSVDCDLSFSAMSSGDFSDIPRSTPRRPIQQSVLTQGLAGSPLPRNTDTEISPETYFEHMAGEEALSAFFRLDSQEAAANLIPYQHDSGYSLINVTPAEPLSPLDMVDPSAVDDFEGTSPGRFHPYDNASFTHAMPHSFPKPQGQVSRDDRLAVPDPMDHRRLRRQRAYSSGSHNPSFRTNASTKPIPIPNQQRNNRPPMPRGSPGSLTHGSRGRRKGPMEATARQLAKKTRNEKTVCIRCRASKLKCQRPMENPDGCCSNCEKAANTSKPPGPCTKAYFEDLVLQSSLDGIYALEMTHPTPNSPKRFRRRLPPDFDLDTFIGQLERYRNAFNLKVCDGDKEVYGLDLEQCFQYMSKVKEGLVSREEPGTDFVAFLDKDAAHADPKTEDWTRMLTNTSVDPRENIIDFYLDIARMSEHVSLFATSRTGETEMEQLLNPAATNEAEILLFAARLTRIISRKVEVAAFLQLQKELHDVLQGQRWQGPKHDFVVFLHRIGRFLVTLRSRNARATASTTSAWPQPPLESRAFELCRVLYSYYHFLRKKLPAIIDETSGALLKGIWMPPAPSVEDTWSTLSQGFTFQSPNPINGEIWHEFPKGNGDGALGFDTWMAEGPEGRSARPGQTMDMWTTSFV